MTPEDGGAANTLMCARHMSSTFFLTKNDNNKKNHYKITIKPLKPKVKNSEWKG
jgi:hypothetical protein